MTTTLRVTLSAGFGRVLWVGLLNGVGLHAHLPNCHVCPYIRVYEHVNKHTHFFTRHLRPYKIMASYFDAKADINLINDFFFF